MAYNKVVASVVGGCGEYAQTAPGDTIAVDDIKFALNNLNKSKVTNGSSP